MLIDHKSTDGVNGLITLIGVRATTARGMASKAVDLITRKIGLVKKSPDTVNIPIFGGDIESFDKEINIIMDRHRPNQRFQARCLVANYGSQWRAVLKHASGDRSLFKSVGKSTSLRVEVLYAVREEMAIKLQDVIFRRTELGTGKNPRIPDVEECAALMSSELGWNIQKKEDEIREVLDVFSTYGPWKVV